jgi:Arm DNA-binding domain
VTNAGKRRQRWKGGFKSRKEAEAFLAKTPSTLDDGLYVQPSKTTVASFLERGLADDSELGRRPAAPT